jgi:hypothetical protein
MLLDVNAKDSIRHPPPGETCQACRGFSAEDAG